MEDKITVVAGRDNMQAVRALGQLHFWRSQAVAKVKLRMTPRPGWTIKLFNEMYQAKAKNWADIAEMAQKMIEDARKGS